jgi:hypothetical protein
MESNKNKLKIIFEGNQEILKAISSGNSLEKIFGLPNEKCHLIDKQILQSESPNEFTIQIPGMGQRLYRVKKGDLKMSYITIPRYNLHRVLIHEGFNWDDIKEIQSKKTIQNYNSKNKKNITIVLPPLICEFNGGSFEIIPYTEANNLGPKVYGKKIFIPKGSYICDSEDYTQFVIGSYTGKFYREGLCINFSDVYSLFTCPKINKEKSVRSEVYQQYIFTDYFPVMQEYKKCISMNTFLETDNPELVQHSVFIQTLFAIALYQEKYQISHNNLSSHTIYLEIINDETQFNGQYLSKMDYFHYKLGGDNIYIPYVPVIVKIGGFSLGMKFSKPIVGLKNIFENGLAKVNPAKEPIVPNTFVKSYDSLMFVVLYCLMLDLKFENLGRFLERCLVFTCPGLTFVHGNLKNQLVEMEYYNSRTARPNLNNVKNAKSALEILEGPVLKEYGRKPRDDKNIILLGELM